MENFYQRVVQEKLFDGINVINYSQFSLYINGNPDCCACDSKAEEFGWFFKPESVRRKYIKYKVEERKGKFKAFESSEDESTHD